MNVMEQSILLVVLLGGDFDVGGAFSGYNVPYKFTTNRSKFRVTNPLYVIEVKKVDIALIRPIPSKSLCGKSI